MTASVTEPIPRVAHGIGDYATVPLVAAAPALAGFTGDRTATRLALGLAGGILVQALTTKAEWGAVRAVPYRTHLRTDMALGLAATAAPWLLGFSRDAAARNTFLALGAGLFAAGLLSDPTEMDADFHS
jgi:hypothetical protein